MNSSLGGLAAAAALALFGLGFALVGAVQLRKSVRASLNWKRAQGRIAGNLEAKNFKGESVYSAKIEFLVEGKPLRFISSWHRGWPFKAGRKIKVLYDPENPSREPRTASFVSQWLGPGVFLGLGLTALALAARAILTS